VSQHTPKWVAGYARGEICDRSTMHLVGRFVTNEDRDRAIACREACTGMSDPVAEIAAKDARIKALEDIAKDFLALLDEPLDLHKDCHQDWIEEKRSEIRALFTPNPEPLSANHA